MTAWSTSDIPDQSGRTAIVTGANSGLGLVTATELARRGARVILAVRNVTSGEEAADTIRSAAPRAEVSVRNLDLASLASVRSFAEHAAELDRVDLLVNNAGVVILGPRRTTADGFELHLGTNHLGHFALTGLLLPFLERGDRPRVVSLSSISHKPAHLDFDDLMFERRWDASAAYGASKLATTTFGIELDRRLRASGSPVISVLAHPGVSRSNLVPRAWADRGWIGRIATGLFLSLSTQPTEQGALPQLRATTAPDAHGGQFFGPSGRNERRGDAIEVQASDEALDPRVGQQLWAASEDLTGVSYP
ncbi:oxidoreductase [Myceligenerans pegani]|uniref:SDR family oxidoreductase n=1 Tax=Myceligenerans pegani TaxID=2776917 RepID=A0ABR9MWE0_9MICO|nr:oxidoreductase [Myceligenerans sp. TRM 65318]MBE1875698.1 SDR family oxidoreductase [Myceligenerans sp. TRM 65318]MBE3017969.1 SDR family oxidoreductase [Myceligenerans sp. TRM 65318]